MQEQDGTDKPRQNSILGSQTNGIEKETDIAGGKPELNKNPLPHQETANPASPAMAQKPSSSETLQAASEDIEIEDAGPFTEPASQMPQPEKTGYHSPDSDSELKAQKIPGWPHAEEVEDEPKINSNTVMSIQKEITLANKRDGNAKTPENAFQGTAESGIRHTAPNHLSSAPAELTDDEEILKFIEETKQKIYIVGSGGSGSNTLDRLFELGTSGTNLVAMNTDARHLLKVRANKKIIIGKKISKGRGAGSNPAVGEKAAKESVDDIQSAISDASLVFITCGLGGGTGTGSAPVIAEIAKNMGALTVAVVTLPFLSEGKIRMENALEGIERLKKHTDTLIVIKNDRLLNLVPDLPLNTAFKVCDEVLAGSVKGIAELVTKSGLVNVDFADLRTILSGAGFAAIGLGEASLDAKHEDRARVAVETALSSPLLDADISSSTRALINVIGGEDMTLKEAEYIVAETSRRINPNAHIIWGSRVEENIKKSSMRVLVVLAGVKFPKYGAKEKDAEIEDLDLDLIG